MSARLGTTRTRPILFAGLALGTLLLAGCGDSSDHPAGGAHGSTPSATASFGPAASGPHNAADVTFATDMLPHHAQAVEMSDLALGRDTDARVQALARQIKAAQAPEIAAMSGWLTGWGAPVPELAMTGMTGHGAEATGMNGMMSADAMTALDGAKGTDFARLYLSGMVEHHRGAVAMAETELTAGTNPEATQLAQSIIDSQNAEIATMTTLLASLGS